MRVVFVSLLFVVQPLLPIAAAAGNAPLDVPCVEACRAPAVDALRACRASGADAETCAANATATFDVCTAERCGTTSSAACVGCSVGDASCAGCPVGAASCVGACEMQARDAYAATLTAHGVARRIRREFRRCIRSCDAGTVTTASSGGAAVTKQTSSPKLPRCLQAMTTHPLLADYAAYIAANANVQQAMNPCKVSTSILSWFYAKLEEAEQAGMPPSAPLPDGFSTTSTDSYVPGGTQSDEILGAKLAHVFWVEVRNKVPWRLASFGSADLKRIFTLCKWPHPCRHDAIVDFAAQYVLDHSPRVAWTVLQQNVDLGALTTPHQAVADVLEHTRAFVHGAVYYDSSGNVVRDDTWGIRTLDEMMTEKVSRHGCWSMVPYAMQLAAALNVPVDGVSDYFDGLGHATALFPATDQVLAHGDDVYNGLLLNTPTRLVLDSYARWQAEVLAYPPGSATAAYNSQTNDKQEARLHPSAYLMEQYCTAGGRAILDSIFTTYATAQQLDALEAQIVTLTNGCATIPLDHR